MSKTEPRTGDKIAVRPATRWCNRYWFARTVMLPDCPSHPGGPFGPGLLKSRLRWPSSEIAETHALRSIERSRFGLYVVYLGAEPETK